MEVSIAVILVEMGMVIDRRNGEASESLMVFRLLIDQRGDSGSNFCMSLQSSYWPELYWLGETHINLTYMVNGKLHSLTTRWPHGMAAGLSQG